MGNVPIVDVIRAYAVVLDGEASSHKLRGSVQHPTGWVLGIPSERRNHGGARQPTDEDGWNRHGKGSQSLEDQAEFHSAIEAGPGAAILRDAFSAAKRPF
jgi:hypothetical protein